MRRGLLFYLVLLLLYLSDRPVFGQQLFLWKTDGTQIPFNLNTQTTLTFSSGSLIINSPIGISSYSLSSLKKLTFDNVSNSKNSIPKMGDKSIPIYYSRSENLIFLQNIRKNNTLVNIYNLNGVVVVSTQVLSGGQTIDVSGLKGGIYLLKINNQTFKFIK